MTPEHLERQFTALDKALKPKGFPALSPFWNRAFRRFFAKAVRQLVLRVGRRGGKSSSLCRLAVVIALYGQHVIPAGDVGVVAFISTTKTEAGERLRTIKAILDALGVRYFPISDGIELEGRPIAFRVFPASIRGVSGFTCIAAFCDEVSKWLDSDTGANPAREVLASLRPTLATQPNARIFLSSSPLGELDAHFDAFELGETEHQCVEYAPTWVANPTLTEEQTRALEPDDAIWRREYEAIPAAEVESSLLTAASVTKCTRTDESDLPPAMGVTYFAAMDPATRGDAWTLVLVGGQPRDPILRVSLLREWKGNRTTPLSPRTVLEEVRRDLLPYQLTTVHTDQASADALRDIGAEVGLQIVVVPTTAASKTALYEDLKTSFDDEQLSIPASKPLRTDLLNVRRRISRSGQSIELPRIGGRHCDFAPSLALAVNRARFFGAREPQERLMVGRTSTRGGLPNRR